MHITAEAWVLTLAVIGGLLAFDWRLHGSHPHRVSLGEAFRWSAFYIAVAILFGVALGVIAGWNLGTQYFAGYLAEKSLSVDNLFVFGLIIATFAVPPERQAKVLTLGITLALALRAVFIALGAALLARFSFMFGIFGLALLATAAGLYRHRNKTRRVEDNPLVGAARRTLPVTDHYDGGRFTTRVRGRRALTPLFLVLLAIGSSDVLFACDSIPAVFGVTNHAFIVFAANAFALLGLRALYFLISDLLVRLVYLSAGLATILTFIGAKLILEFAHHQDPALPTVPTGPSLAIIASVLAVTIIASEIKTRASAAPAQTGAPPEAAGHGQISTRSPHGLRSHITVGRDDRDASTIGAKEASDAQADSSDRGGLGGRHRSPRSRGGGGLCPPVLGGGRTTGSRRSGYDAGA